MATTNLTLTTDPSDQRITFDIPAKAAPYARAYFNDSGLKRGNETIELFICRLFCERAVRWKTADIMAAQRKTHSDLDTLDEVDLNNQANVILAP